MVAPDVKARLLRDRLADGQTWIPTDGSSMGRRWQPGSRVLLVVVEQAPQRGEVWAFCAEDGRVVVHRHIGWRDGGHVFRGDAALRPDGVVPAAWLIGRVDQVDDGQRIWRPTRWHQVSPRMVGVGRAVLRRMSGATD